MLAQTTKSFAFAAFIAACSGIVCWLFVGARARAQICAAAPKTTDTRIDTALNDHYAFILKIF
jgi:hypothetical protein